MTFLEALATLPDSLPLTCPRTLKTLGPGESMTVAQRRKYPDYYTGNNYQVAEIRFLRKKRTAIMQGRVIVLVQE